MTHLEDVEALAVLAREAAESPGMAIMQTGLGKLLDRIEAIDGHEQRSRVLNRACVELLRRNRPKIDDLDYPGALRARFHDEFVRIERALAEESVDSSLRDQAVRSDLRILAFTRLPTGCQHMEVAGIPRSLAWAGGPRQAIRFVRMLAETRGLKPYYVLHLAHHGIDRIRFVFQVSEQKLIECYRLVAEILRERESIRGIIMGGWLYDPALKEVSPHLAHLRRLVVDAGAYQFRAIDDEVNLRPALEDAPQRQKLHEQGLYRPADYKLIWPRGRVLSWAEAQS